jgi:DNA-binding winged helix-turn-helix (wHTH) protein
MKTPPDDGLIRVDEQAHKAWKGSERLVLSRLEFACLARLARTPGKIVTPEQFKRDVWQTDWWGNAGHKTLQMHIALLRKKLGDDAANPRYIETVRSVGIRLIEDAAVPVKPPVSEVKQFLLPLRIDRHGQMIWDANDVLVAAAMSPSSARWIVECANAGLNEAEAVSGG